MQVAGSTRCRSTTSSSGSGVPLIALHGAGASDHREGIEAANRGRHPGRRLPADLSRSTGHGSPTTGTDAPTRQRRRWHCWPTSSITPSTSRFCYLGHSYGAYLARGIAARRRDAVLGLALLCPIGESSRRTPAATTVARADADAYRELEPDQRAGSDDYFVVRNTCDCAHAIASIVVPGDDCVDEATLGRIFAGWKVAVGSDTFGPPSLIAAGRLDSSVGTSRLPTYSEHYPHATFAVLDDAGHALPARAAGASGRTPAGLARSTVSRTK